VGTPEAVRPAFLFKRISRSATAIRCELELELERPTSPGARVDLLHVRMVSAVSASNTIAAILVLSDAGLAVTGRVEFEGTAVPLAEHVFGPVPQPSRWHHVRLTMTPLRKSYTFEVDGIGAQQPPWDEFTDAIASTEVSLGILYGTIGPFRAAFDDVVCDVDP
jgi:hypothetical protein